MRLGRIIGSLTSTLKHPAYEGRSLQLVQPIRPDGTPDGPAVMAVDSGISAGTGDVVLYSAAPGLAPALFRMEICPIADVIVGVVDYVDCEGRRLDCAAVRYDLADCPRKRLPRPD